ATPASPGRGRAGAPTGRPRHSARRASRPALLALVDVEAVVEGFQADTEDGGRLLLVAVVVIERREDEVALRLAERGADPQRRLRSAGPGGRGHGGRAEVGRKARRLDLALGHDVGALHGVLELAHVAGPF